MFKNSRILYAWQIIKTRNIVDSKMSSRLQWTNQEEEKIKHLHEVQRVKSWKIIAEKLNSEFLNLKRSGKQCRERYVNYIRFTESQVKTVTWSPEDDKKFTDLYFQYGAKWASIVVHLPEKSENSLKNRFYGGLRRVIRKINKIEYQYRMRKSKPLRYEGLLRVLEYNLPPKIMESHSSQRLDDFAEFIHSTKLGLLKTSWNVLNGESQDQEIVSLIHSIHQFNSRVRSQTFTSPKKFESQSSNLQEGETQQQKQIKPTTEHKFEEDPYFSKQEEPLITRCASVLQFEDLRFSESKTRESELFAEEIASYNLPVENCDNGEELDRLVSKIYQTEYTSLGFSFYI